MPRGDIREARQGSSNEAVAYFLRVPNFSDQQTKQRTPLVNYSAQEGVHGETNYNAVREG